MSDIATHPFRLSFGDYARFTLLDYYRRAFTTYLAIFLAAITLVLPALMFVADKTPHRYLNLAEFIALSLALWFILIPAVSLYSFRKQYRSKESLRCERIVRVTEQGVDITGPAVEIHLTWQNFTRLRQNRDQVLLYIGAGAAYIVPKSALATQGDLESFMSLAKARIASSRHPQANVFDPPPQTIDLPGAWHTGPFPYTPQLHISSYIRLFYASFLNPSTLLTTIVFSSLVPLWINRSRLMLGDWSGIARDALGFVPVIIIIFAIMPVILAVWSWNHIRKQASARGSRSAALTPERIVCTGPSYRVEILLSDLRDIRRSGGLLLFYTRPNCAIAVPVSAFPDKASAQAFYDQARTWWRAAKSAPASNSSLDAKG